MKSFFDLFSRKKKNLQETSKIDIEIRDNFYKIDIKEDISFMYYIDSINKFIDKDISNKIASTIIMSDYPNINKKTIYLINLQDSFYTISISDNEICVSEKVKLSDCIKERVVSIDKKIKQYDISVMIHDFNHSTKSVKGYSSDNEIDTFFLLDKKIALNEICDLLDNMENIEEIKSFISSFLVYDISLYFNLVRKYNPIISNGEISLCYWNGYNNNMKYCNFDIVLDETKEKIGNISFYYSLDNSFSFCGNVGYSIKEQFRNNHYATKALWLLRQLLKLNEYDGVKDLYISTLPDNIYSQKVAMNNDGFLYYEGKVPSKDSLYCIDGIRKVKVYKIEV